MVNSVKNIRLQNRKNVLMLIAKEPNLTRFEIATKLNISLMTVTNVIEDLLHFNLIGEEKSEASIGRTPSQIFLAKKSSVFLCVDLTSKEVVSYTFFKLNGEIFLSSDIPFVETVYKENFLKLFEQLSKIIIKEGLEIAGIGICINGIYYKETDAIKNCNVNELQFSNIYKIFSKFFNCKNVIVENNFNLIAKSLKENNVCLLNINNNINLNYINDGAILQGACKMLGQIGNCLVGDPIFKVTLNSLASIDSIEKYIKTLGLNYEIDEIITRYNAGDDRFSNHLNYIFGILNSTIYNLFWQYNPSKLFINSTSEVFANTIISKFNAFSLELSDKNNNFNELISIYKLSSNTYLQEMCENLREQFIGNLIN